MLEIGWSWRMRVRTAAQVAAREQQVGEDDGDGEDDADEAFGEDVEGAAGGEGVAEEAGSWIRRVAARWGTRLGLCFGEPEAERARVSQRQTIASGMMMRVKMKMPKLESRMSAA